MKHTILRVAIVAAFAVCTTPVFAAAKYNDTTKNNTIIDNYTGNLTVVQFNNSGTQLTLTQNKDITFFSHFYDDPSNYRNNSIIDTHKSAMLLNGGSLTIAGTGNTLNLQSNYNGLSLLGGASFTTKQHLSINEKNQPGGKPTYSNMTAGIAIKGNSTLTLGALDIKGMSNGISAVQLGDRALTFNGPLSITAVGRSPYGSNISHYLGGSSLALFGSNDSVRTPVLFNDIVMLNSTHNNVNKISTGVVTDAKGFFTGTDRPFNADFIGVMLDHTSVTAKKDFSLTVNATNTYAFGMIVWDSNVHIEGKLNLTGNFTAGTKSDHTSVYGTYTLLSVAHKGATLIVDGPAVLKSVANSKNMGKSVALNISEANTQVHFNQGLQTQKEAKNGGSYDLNYGINFQDNTQGSDVTVTGALNTDGEVHTTPTTSVILQGSGQSNIGHMNARSGGSLIIKDTQSVTVNSGFFGNSDKPNNGVVSGLSTGANTKLSWLGPLNVAGTFNGDVKGSLKTAGLDMRGSQAHLQANQVEVTGSVSVTQGANGTIQSLNTTGNVSTDTQGTLNATDLKVKGDIRAHGDGLITADTLTTTANPDQQPTASKGDLTVGTGGEIRVKNSIQASGSLSADGVGTDKKPSTITTETGNIQAGGNISSDTSGVITANKGAVEATGTVSTDSKGVISGVGVSGSTITSQGGGSINAGSGAVHSTGTGANSGVYAKGGHISGDHLVVDGGSVSATNKDEQGGTITTTGKNSTNEIHGNISSDGTGSHIELNGKSTLKGDLNADQAGAINVTGPLQLGNGTTPSNVSSKNGGSINLGIQDKPVAITGTVNVNATGSSGPQNSSVNIWAGDNSNLNGNINTSHSGTVNTHLNGTEDHPAVWHGTANGDGVSIETNDHGKAVFEKGKSTPGSLSGHIAINPGAVVSPKKNGNLIIENPDKTSKTDDTGRLIINKNEGSIYFANAKVKTEVISNDGPISIGILSKDGKVHHSNTVYGLVDKDTQIVATKDKTGGYSYSLNYIENPTQLGTVAVALLAQQQAAYAWLSDVPYIPQTYTPKPSTNAALGLQNQPAVSWASYANNKKAAPANKEGRIKPHLWAYAQLGTLNQSGQQVDSHLFHYGLSGGMDIQLHAGPIPVYVGAMLGVGKADLKNNANDQSWALSQWQLGLYGGVHFSQAYVETQFSYLGLNSHINSAALNMDTQQKALRFSIGGGYSFFLQHSIQLEHQLEIVSTHIKDIHFKGKEQYNELTGSTEGTQSFVVRAGFFVNADLKSLSSNPLLGVAYVGFNLYYEFMGNQTLNASDEASYKFTQSQKGTWLKLSFGTHTNFNKQLQLFLQADLLPVSFRSGFDLKGGLEYQF